MVQKAIFLLKIFFIISQIKAQAHFKAEGKSVACTYNSQLITNFTCSLEKKNRNDIWLYEAYGLPDVQYSDLFLKVSVMHKFVGETGFKPFLGVNNLTLDLCKYMDGSKGSMLIDMFINDVKKYGNVVHPCPLSGYNYVRQTSTDTNTLPPIIPAGDYLSQVLLYQKINNAFVQLLTVKTINGVTKIT